MNEDLEIKEVEECHYINGKIVEKNKEGLYEVIEVKFSKDRKTKKVTSEIYKRQGDIYFSKKTKNLFNLDSETIEDRDEYFVINKYDKNNKIIWDYKIKKSYNHLSKIKTFKNFIYVLHSYTKGYKNIEIVKLNKNGKQIKKLKIELNKEYLSNIIKFNGVNEYLNTFFNINGGFNIALDTGKEPFIISYDKNLEFLRYNRLESKVKLYTEKIIRTSNENHIIIGYFKDTSSELSMDKTNYKGFFIKTDGELRTKKIKGGDKVLDYLMFPLEFIKAVVLPIGS